MEHDNSTVQRSRSGRKSLNDTGARTPNVMTRSQLKRFSLANLPGTDEEEEGGGQKVNKRASVKSSAKKPRSSLTSDLLNEKSTSSTKSNKRLHKSQEDESILKEKEIYNEHTEISPFEEETEKKGMSSQKARKCRTKNVKDTREEENEVEKVTKKKVRYSLNSFSNNECADITTHLSDNKSLRSVKEVKSDITEATSNDNVCEKILNHISENILVENEDVRNVNTKKKASKKNKHQITDNKSFNSDMSYNEKYMDNKSKEGEKGMETVPSNELESPTHEEINKSTEMFPPSRKLSKKKIISHNSSEFTSELKDFSKSGSQEQILKSKKQTFKDTSQEDTSIDKKTVSKDVSLDEQGTDSLFTSTLPSSKTTFKSKKKKSHEDMQDISTTAEQEREGCPSNIEIKRSSKEKAIKSNEMLYEIALSKKAARENGTVKRQDLSKEYKSSVTEEIIQLRHKTFAMKRSISMLKKGISDQGDGSGQEADSDAECRKAIMESAQKRIEQNLSTSESDSRLFRGVHIPISHISKNVSSDSDSIQEISFEAGKKQHIESLKDAADHIKKQKQKMKERRKARLEMLKQQKEEKLIRLKEKMASQEDASCSSSEESGYEEEVRNARQKMRKKKAKSKSQSTEKENLDDVSIPGSHKTHSGVESDDSSDKDLPVKDSLPVNLKRLPSETFEYLHEPIPSKIPKVGVSNGKISEDSKKKKNKVEKFEEKEKDFKNLTSLDYIPLKVEGATNFMVVPLDRALHGQTIAEKAMEFRQNALYGSHIRREPAKVHAVYQQKLKAAGNDQRVQ